MNLCIDIGNSGVKVAVFRQQKIIASFRWEQIGEEQAGLVKNRWPGIENVILCSVREDDEKHFGYLNDSFPFVIMLDDNTEVPVTNLYTTPATLGKDRLAGVAGARNNYPGRTVLVVDAGTAVTFDLVDEQGRYLGGNISPGISMRLRALHEFTGKLPLVSPPEKAGFIADNTENAIAWGVVNGILYEIETYIGTIKQKYTDPVIIFTGGDAGYFDKKVKSTIFVDPDLVLTGLNVILNHNVSKK
ncbi:MAG: type III pantothenate kinase [Marinilabiliales bacterium]|nr:MAG: type III pantothenate kinase [Marinilabiliales bacterium]